MTKEQAKEGELYHPSDEEWAAIQEGLEQAKRGEFVPDDEMDALLADIKIGLRELDAGLGKELDIADVIKKARQRHR